MSYLIPIQYRITWVPESFNGDHKVFKIFKIILDCLTDYFCAAALQLSGCSIQCIDKWARQTCSYLRHGNHLKVK